MFRNGLPEARRHGVLMTLAGEGFNSKRGIGEKLAIDRTTMVDLLDELEGMGLVGRRSDP